MKKLLDDLCKLIVKQTDLYAALRETLEREREIILSSSVEELGRSNKKKEVVILQIKLLDESCSLILEGTGHNSYCSGEVGSLSRILESIDHPDCLPAKSAYARLGAVVQEVKRLNIENDRLIRGSLRAIKSSISFLVACASAANACYESSGQMRNEQITMTLLNEEV